MARFVANRAGFLPKISEHSNFGDCLGMAKRDTYSWTGRQEHARKKSICQQTEIATDIPKPPLESSRKGASSPGVSFFVSSFSAELCFGTSSIMNLQNKTHLGGMRLAETFPTAVSDPS